MHLQEFSSFKSTTTFTEQLQQSADLHAFYKHVLA